MANGTIWGHGAYLGPDFSAQYLHNWALDAADHAAQARFRRAYGELTPEERGEIDGSVARTMKENRYDPSTGTLTLSATDADSFKRQIAYWTDYFVTPANNGGLAAKLVADPQQLRELTAFFAWTAWASTAARPGTSHSYTNNFPYDPLAGNVLTGGPVIYSVLSLVFLLGGTAIVLLAFGKFAHLGWHSPQWRPAHAATPPTPAAVFETTQTQRASLKFMAVAALLFLGQVLIGGGVAHYRAEPGDFFGLDLSAFLPSNLLRVWHVQLAILWIATAYVGGALFVAGMLGRNEPAGQRRAIHLLFAAVVFVAVGSLLGEWAGILQWLGKAWFWFGNQGWEYLEIGRAWQILLAIGLVFWFGLLWRNVAAARRDPERRGLVTFFLIAAAAIPVFYLPALVYDGTTHFTIVDTWRFWIIHLWVEGFFELFVTVIVGIIFFELGLVERDTALRVIYLDVILIFGGGLIGTGHHWYFNGQTELNMALSAAFSALEVVPLTLITLDAWDFVTVTKGRGQRAIPAQMDVLLPDGRGFLEFHRRWHLRVPHQHADRQLLRDGHEPNAQSWPRRDDGRVRHAGRCLDGVRPAPDDVRRGLASSGALRPMRILGPQHRSRDDGGFQPVSFRHPADVRRHPARLLARAQPRLYGGHAAADAGMAAHARRPGVHFPGRAADRDRPLPRLSRPVGKAHDSCGATADCGGISETDIPLIQLKN